MSAQDQTTTQSAAAQDAPLDPSSDDFLDRVAQIFCDSGGLGTGEILGLDDEQKEQLYAFGSTLYESGQFEKSCDVFSHLCRWQPDDPRFVKALGMARQMAKQYEGAVEAYSVAVLHDLEDTEVSIHVAECLLHLGEIGRARAAVRGAALQIASRSVSDELRHKMQVIEKSLESYDAAARTDAISANGEPKSASNANSVPQAD